MELPKFFDIEDRTPAEQREVSKRADMLRLFRAILEEREVSDEKLLNLLDKEFMKDVSFKSYTGEILLEEVDGMLNILYEKEGAYLRGHLKGRAQGRREGRAEGVDSRNRELAKGFRDAGFPVDAISQQTGLTVEDIIAL